MNYEFQGERAIRFAVSMKWFMLMMVVVIAFLVRMQEVYATETISYYHSHDASCYQEVTETVTCTNTATMTPGAWSGYPTHYQTLYCSQCQEKTSCGVYQRLHYCAICGKHNGYSNNYAMCSKCGQKQGEWNDWGFYVHSYQVPVKKLICGLTEQSEVARMTLSVNTVGYTREILLKGAYEILSPLCKLEDLPFVWNGQASNQSEWKVEDNGEVRLELALRAGAMAAGRGIAVTIHNIDREIPMLELTKQPGEGAWTSGNATVYVNALDYLSGLAEEAYSYDRGVTWTNNAQLTVANSATVEVWVRDVAGNIATASIALTKQPPQPQQPQQPQTLPESPQGDKEQGGSDESGDLDSLAEGQEVEAVEPKEDSSLRKEQAEQSEGDTVSVEMTEESAAQSQEDSADQMDKQGVAFYGLPTKEELEQSQKTQGYAAGMLDAKSPVALGDAMTGIGADSLDAQEVPAIARLLDYLSYAGVILSAMVLVVYLFLKYRMQVAVHCKGKDGEYHMIEWNPLHSMGGMFHISIGKKACNAALAGQIRLHFSSYVLKKYKGKDITVSYQGCHANLRIEQDAVLHINGKFGTI